MDSTEALFGNPRTQEDKVEVYETGRVSLGGQGRNRTADASLFRAALYRLSYLAAKRLL